MTPPSPRRLIRASDITFTPGPGPAFTLHVVPRGLTLRVPAQALALLQACHVPRTEDEIADLLGPPFRALYQDLARVQVLQDPEATDPAQAFFHAFSRVDVHHRMLADRFRLDAYARAISAAVRPGDVVLDAGTGSGVLAIMAALTGAERVYAVDRSDFLDMAGAVVAANGLQEQVRLVRGDMARVRLPEKVDVVVTETFGALALVEGSAPELLACCEANLKPGGRVVPHGIRFLAAPVLNPGPQVETLGPFDPFLGISFGPLRDLALTRGNTLVLDPSHLGDGGQVFAECPFPQVSMPVSGQVYLPPMAGPIHGIAAWFDLLLAEDQVLSTAPMAPPTHWGQTYLPLATPFPEDREAWLSLRLEPSVGDPRSLSVRLLLQGGQDTREATYQIR